MKLVSFITAGKTGYGVVKGDRVANLAARHGDRWPTLRALLAAGSLPEAARLAEEVPADLALERLALLPVIPDPDKIICVGLNYRDHVAETGRTETPNPALFGRFAGSQVGHLQPMIRPKVSERLDYEGELAVIIGTGGRHIAEADSLQHVAGYACYNEGSCGTGRCTPASSSQARRSPEPAPSVRGW